MATVTKAPIEQNYEISPGLVKGLIEYLGTRPVNEAMGLVSALLRLELAPPRKNKSKKGASGLLDESSNAVKGAATAETPAPKEPVVIAQRAPAKTPAAK